MAVRLIMTKGLPGAGKTHWAKEVSLSAPSKFAIVCKDDLRDMIDAGKWTQSNEKFILKVRDSIIKQALQAGRHVICADTNLSERHETTLRQIAHEFRAEFEIKDFTHVSVETCIERDLKRLNSVGKDVIMDMWRKYLRPKPPVIEYDPALPDCVVVDIDGTVALMNGRSPYDYSLVHTDVPNTPIVNLVNTIADQNNAPHILFVSGRKAECEKATQLWLEDLFHFKYPLFMRADGDDRDDRIVKQEIYERVIKGKFNVWFWIDDRKKVVDHIRSLGITVLQVAEGDF